MADFVFSRGALPDDYRAGGYGWELDWFGSGVNARVMEAAKIAINGANEAAAEDARNNHPWQDDTYQTRESVFVRAAEYSPRREVVWGNWGVRDLPRVPERISGMGIFGSSYPEYEGKTLTTKDVAFLLEFGFHTRQGQYRQYPWLYPAWDKEKGTVLARFRAAYEGLGGGGKFRRPIYLPPAFPGARVARSTGGWFIPLGPYYID